MNFKRSQDLNGGNVKETEGKKEIKMEKVEDRNNKREMDRETDTREIELLG